MLSRLLKTTTSSVMFPKTLSGSSRNSKPPSQIKSSNTDYRVGGEKIILIYMNPMMAVGNGVDLCQVPKEVFMERIQEPLV